MLKPHCDSEPDLDNATGEVLNYIVCTQARVLHFLFTNGHGVTLGVKTMKKMVKQVLKKSSCTEKLRLYGVLGGEARKEVTYREAAIDSGHDVYAG